MSIQVLSGHVSPETAFLVESYPYGFRLRCQIRYWIETKKGFGQRVMSQTSNPKRPGLVWNKPKGSTYSLLRVLFLDEQGHVQNDALTAYADEAQIAAFEALYGPALTDFNRAFIVALRAAQARYAARKAAASEPHTVGTEAPTPENDPVGRFKGLTD